MDPIIGRLSCPRSVKTPPQKRVFGITLSWLNSSSATLGLYSTPSLSLLPGPLRHGVVISIKILFIGHIPLFENE